MYHVPNMPLSNDMAVVVVAAVICIKEGRKKEMFYLTTHSTHFIYGYMTSDIW